MFMALLTCWSHARAVAGANATIRTVAVQVALGEAVGSSISSYLAQQEAAGGVACEVDDDILLIYWSVQWG
jgi:hypothetical protein